jgi:hypothetical protein
MIAETKKAVVGATAKTNIEQLKSYRQTFGESNRKILKRRIGETLLNLVTGNAEQNAWRLFDRLLHRLYEGGTI